MYRFIAANLMSKKEKEQIDKVFRAMDISGNGKLAKEEIREGFEKYYTRDDYTSDNFEQIFDEIDADKSGEVEYSEFLVASLTEKNLRSNNKVEQAFRLFDKDGGGSISVEEIEEVLEGTGIDDAILQEVL